MSKDFQQSVLDRVLVLDGGMGTMIQRLDLTERDFRSERFRDWNCDLRGNNDILSLTSPDAIACIHREYVLAGADIISTNSFNANAVSQSDYGLEAYVGEINRGAAAVARKVADEMSALLGRRIWVAGSVGPTNRSASMSPQVEDPAMRNITFDDLRRAYREQIAALVDGGSDLILAETVFDTLNLKSALMAARDVSRSIGRQIPVMVSVTVSDRSGRILSGQSLEALLVSIEGFENVVSLGLNCSMGARDMGPYLETLHSMSPFPVSCHPNAGLPDALGQYRETAVEFADAVEPYLSRGMVNVIGGCCGTTPEHIRLVAELAYGAEPRKPLTRSGVLRLSGLEVTSVTPENNFVNIGERCNVAGSRKFLRLIKGKSYEEAASIAAAQVESGAMMVDVNMDDALLDAPAEMTHFLNLIASDPDVARVPVVIDSSDWAVVSAGLRCLQGKGVVNSISLKEGEAEFLRKAKEIKDFGATMVVMAFDEKGQADTYERKIEICGRAYRLLTQEVGVAPSDTIFDPNIMAVATGIPEHDFYGRDFIRATSWIKTNLPGAKVSGGVSNLSFSFRGNNPLREAMHAVFLYHASRAGLDMAIVNPNSSVVYDDIPADLRTMIEDLIIRGDNDAAGSLGNYAMESLSAVTADASDSADRSQIPVDRRLTDAVIRGVCDHLDADIAEALGGGAKAVGIVEGPLMAGIEEVGRRFGEGKMFLPQVVKASRAMKRAVEILRPEIEAQSSGNRAACTGKVLFATVKGDVHDIGKNIVSIVLECNNFEVVDLGVMVPAETIVEQARSEKPDVICLSGLITPSLGEMVNVADALSRAGLDIPIIVGGATTSKIHTALKIAPVTDSVVVHATDAAQTPLIASRLLSDSQRGEFVEKLREDYSAIVAAHSRPSLLSLEEATGRRKAKPTPAPVPRVSEVRILESLPVDDVVGLINWRPFFHAWKLDCDAPHCSDRTCREEWALRHGGSPEKAREALRLYDDALELIAALKSDGGPVVSGAVAIYPASATDDTLTVGPATVPVLRQQHPGESGHCLSVADYVAAEGDHVGVFAVTTGSVLRRAISEAADDPYRNILTRTLADRFAEAASEYLHWLVRRDIWGYSPNESLTPREIFGGAYRGIRPAMGYPMLPDQTLNLELCRLLPLERLGITMTENGAMTPASTVTGLYIANPDARYFMVGQIAEDQLADYASRRGTKTDRMRRILIRNLA